MDHWPRPADIGTEPWPTLAEAVEAAKALRGQGWTVRMYAAGDLASHPRRVDDSRILATVHHPDGAQAGEVCYWPAPEPDDHGDPGE